jgi:hypothetical protein
MSRNTIIVFEEMLTIRSQLMLAKTYKNVAPWHSRYPVLLCHLTVGPPFRLVLSCCRRSSDW